MAINPISKSRLASVPEALSRPLFVAAWPRHLKAGQVLFAAGDAGDGCYLLDRGLLTVTVTSSCGYAVSQRIRKRIEEAFGWIKTIAGQEKTSFRGRDRVAWAFTFAAAAYNLVRLPKLIAEAGCTGFCLARRANVVSSLIRLRASSACSRGSDEPPGSTGRIEKGGDPTRHPASRAALLFILHAPVASSSKFSKFFRQTSIVASCRAPLLGGIAIAARPVAHCAARMSCGREPPGC
jgi:hypothetical protein